MPETIYILDLLGTLTFAYIGALVGIRRKFDLFGIFTTAFLTAVGGGTIRDVILGDVPFYFFDTFYVLFILLGAFTAIVLFRISTRIHEWALYVDAFGLVSLALIGAEKAANEGLGYLGIILLATISAVGGGLIRDITIAETPQIFYRDVYALPAIFLGVLYVFITPFSFATLALIVLPPLFFRFAVIYYRWNLWGPYRT